MKRWVLLGAVALGLIFSGSPADACSLCLGGMVFAPGQQLDVAEQAVLAEPVAGGTQWRIVEVAKGSALAGQVITDPVDGSDEAAMRGDRPWLLLRHGQWPQWASVGAVGVEYAGWLRQLAATGPTAERTEVDWRSRVALVAPYLEDREPAVAAIAHGEIARAPYGALRSLKARLEAATIARWLDDPTLAARRPAYTLLLGMAGGPADAERLEERLRAAWGSRDATNLGAMLAADLELRGPSRVAWIETMYLADRRRTMPEIAAAVEALSEHGDEDGTVPRARVIEAYLFLMRERKPMAAMVAGDLAQWEYWDAVTEYAALLTSNVRLDRASRRAIVSYLEGCPCAEAKTALASLPVVPENPPSEEGPPPRPLPGPTGAPSLKQE
jgi:hypothetical protein